MADLAPPLIDNPAAIPRGEPIDHRGNHARVLFGPGAIERLPEVLDTIGASRVLVLCTPDRKVDGEAVAMRLGDRTGVVCAEAVMHSPATVSDRVANLTETFSTDLLLAVGGGSSIGLAKAVYLRTGLPQVAIPTTYAGSELTPILGETRNDIKTTIRDDALRPGVVLYDSDLTMSLPPAVAAASGMNAMAHAVEALYMAESPEVGDVAAAAVRALASALPAIVANPVDAVARARGLYGAWLAGFCLAESPMALHHKLCHALGGAFDLPHAETHSVILAHAYAYNAVAVPEAHARLTALFGGDPAEAMFRLVEDLGLPTSLAALGMPAGGIETIVRLTTQNAYANPRPLDAVALTRLLDRAWAGKLPATEHLHHA